MKLGVGTYTFPWAIGVPVCMPKVPMDSPGLLHAAHSLGVSIVQICDNMPLTAPQWDATILEACRLGLGLEVGTRGVDPDHLAHFLAVAARAGSSILRVVTDTADDKPTPEQIVENLRHAVADARSVGVCIALENHDRFPAAVLRWVVERLDSPFVGACLDTVNSFGALEGPEVVVNELASLCVNLHAKDFTLRRVDHQMGFAIEGCPSGQGCLDMPRLLDRLRGNGRDPNVILEQWTPPAGTISETVERERAWARQSIDYLRTLISG